MKFKNEKTEVFESFAFLNQKINDIFGTWITDSISNGISISKLFERMKFSYTV